MIRRLLLLGALLAPGAGVAAPLELAGFAEIDGEAVATRNPDAPVNPASVVKIGTALSALSAVGPDHRFETRFRFTGSLEPVGGRIAGDLLVLGADDPDFHFENAVLVARQLNELGVRTIGGRLLLDRRFLIGWELGAGGRREDPAARSREMAARLRRAWDPAHWSRAERSAFDALASRQAWPSDTAPPSVTIEAGIGEVNRGGGTELLVHRSNPLQTVLRRFAAYSNNDIERLEAIVGSPPALAARLSTLLGGSPIRLATLSGLDSNEMTTRQMVGLLDALADRLATHHLQPSAVLPVAGCDPGTLHLYPGLDASPGSLTAKTGTLTETDGGVAVLAGYLATARGELRFAAAVPRAGGRLTEARRAIATWVLELVARSGGFRPRACPPHLPYSDQSATVLAAPASGGEVERVGPQMSEGDNLERGGLGRPQDDRWGHASLQRLEPARRADAPPVTGS